MFACFSTASAASRSLTYISTATRRLSRSYGVYDGLQPPLALYYCSQPSNPCKDRLAPSKTPRRRLFWPGAAFARIYRLDTDASSKICPWRVLYRFWLQITCTNVYYFFLARWSCSDTYRAFLGSQRVEGTAAGEWTTSIDPQAPGKSQTIIVEEILWSQK